jgi:hypothetical protein
VSRLLVTLPNAGDLVTVRTRWSRLPDRIERSDKWRDIVIGLSFGDRPGVECRGRYAEALFSLKVLLDLAEPGGSA